MGTKDTLREKVDFVVSRLKKAEEAGKFLDKREFVASAAMRLVCSRAKILDIITTAEITGQINKLVWK